ncbi:hypothetical protein D3C81_1556050 [compost metagenome]
MVDGVVHQHQMSQAIQGPPQAIEIEVGPDVAIDHQERLVTQQRQGPEDTAAGFQRLAFRRIADGQAKARTIPEMRLDLRAEPGMVDHQLAKPRCHQGIEVELDQRGAGGTDQRLGRMQGQGAHALALASREDHGLHSGTTSSSGMPPSNSPSSASSGRRATTASI